MKTLCVPRVTFLLMTLCARGFQASTSGSRPLTWELPPAAPPRQPGSPRAAWAPRPLPILQPRPVQGRRARPPGHQRQGGGPWKGGVPLDLRACRLPPLEGLLKETLQKSRKADSTGDAAKPWLSKWPVYAGLGGCRGEWGQREPSTMSNYLHCSRG